MRSHSLVCCHQTICLLFHSCRSVHSSNRCSHGGSTRMGHKVCIGGRPDVEMDFSFAGSASVEAAPVRNPHARMTRTRVLKSIEMDYSRMLAHATIIVIGVISSGMPLLDHP
ncbi:hypothetical protein PR003_g17928 [Phytophthora rubi]|uniref:Uncharacterized protein n=1 Tax=Phytophthora rubi TaxID=129364 RepID=A0A6A4EAL4_9STRA|nr:hypothetical protein PR002_g17182 [Phytophthora rubi]KAE9006635.1 hypothetical protein PR001_g17157 [Phytophthora rubi]KAE9319601.1 hypothetical protein PR003_g17928 [Phytophthora rubi]